MTKPLHCQVCKKTFKQPDLFPLELVHDLLLKKIELDTNDLDQNGYICLPDLEKYQLARSRDILQLEVGELDEVEEEVLSDIEANHLVSENINEEYEESLTFGERMADHISEFGGSWRFISIFFVLLASWIILNSWMLIAESYDPYPFILLNLVLSCLAAIQAPIIMMSQNRQAEKDRLAAENDYKVNLKSELLILQLTAKLDLLMKKQWLRMLEHQQTQQQTTRAILSVQQLQQETNKTLLEIQSKLTAK